MCRRTAKSSIGGCTMTAALKFTAEEHHHRGRLIRLVVLAEHARNEPDPIDEFFSAMRDFAAGGTLTPQRAHLNFTQMAVERGWPAITERKLTKQLVARGCRKRVLDLRSGEANRRDRLRKYSGKLRPVVIEFPGEESAE